MLRIAKFAPRAEFGFAELTGEFNLAEAARLQFSYTPQVYNLAAAKRQFS
jgi:hypothetical protein